MKNSDVNSARAHQYIRKRIPSGEFAPGQRLMAKALSDEIQVSPTPVRGIAADEAEAAHLRAVLADHEAVYAAIARRDPAAARGAMERSLKDITDQTIHRMAQREREMIARELTEEMVSDRA